MKPISVYQAGLEKLIMNMDKRKAAGPDCISPYLLQHFTLNIPSFLPCLTKVISSSIKESSVPTDWKNADIRPLFKGGRRDKPENYRPISLTSLISKMVEHVICTSMWSHINKHQLLVDSQHGFRSGYNTTTQLLHVIHKANEALDRKELYHLVSFDFSKAFDKVPHRKLILKLRYYCFNHKLISWIENWLNERKSFVSINGKQSEKISVVSGVPQGSVLGPLLFLLYINDMNDVIKYSECRLYADDSLLCFNETIHGQNALQQDVTAMECWASKWDMVFNVTKCVHITIGRTLPINLQLAGTVIPHAAKMKYLGVYIQSTLKWDFHILTITKKANKTLGLLRRCLSEADSKTKLVSFNSITRPILEYASPVWSPYIKARIHDLDRVHRKAIRWIYYMDKLDSVTEMMNSNNIQSLSDRRDEIDTKFLRRIEFGDYDLDLGVYISFNSNFNTRGNSINPHFNTTQFQHCFFNRMRPQVKVYFSRSGAARGDVPSHTPIGTPTTLPM